MRTKQIQVFKFEELKPEIQEKVLNEHRDFNTSYDWYNFLFEDFKEELNKIGLDCEGFYFDLYDRTISFNNQTITDQELFINSILSIEDKILIKLQEEDLNQDNNEFINLSISENGFIEDYQEILKPEYQEKLTEFVKDKLNDFFKRLDKEYEYLTSDESIKEGLICNKYEFNIKGDIV